ncbi:MAG: HEAT repeat domain-containing protein [Sphingosinicella sp.]
MKPGDELRAWIVDPGRQREARLAADRLALGWAQGPAHQDFAAALEKLDSPSAEQVAAAVQPLFEDVGWVDTLIKTLAAAMRSDPFFEPPFRHINSDIHRGLIVYEDEHVSIGAGVTSAARLAAKKAARRRGSIHFSGQVELIRFVRGGARLSFWHAPAIGADFCAASAGRCAQTCERPLADGETLVINGRCESFVIEHAAADLMLLQASVKPDRAPVSAEFDAASGDFLGCAAADDSASRIQMITTLLRKLGQAGAFEALAAFLDHHDFFVRWHVMRELLGVDTAAALPHLKRMAAGDPHRETRKTARTALDWIERGEAQRRAA